MDQTNLKEDKKINGLLARARDLLLDWSREALRADGDDESSQADKIFAFAKDADDLRRRIIAVKDGKTDTTANKSNTVYYVGEQGKSQGFPEIQLNKSDYPKYFRLDDGMIRVGLKKDKKTEYKHFLSEHRYNMIVKLAANAGKGGKEFTAKDLLKDFDGPSNDMYIALSLFHRKKLAKVIRRGIYKLENDVLSTAAESIWKGLPEEFYE